MRCSTKNLQIVLCFVHLVLGVSSIALGVVCIDKQEASYNNGVHGMGIWLGVWMLITGLSGFLVTNQPINARRTSFFIGYCCVTMVTMLVCCIPLIVGPIMYFSFESSVSKHYYKEYGPSKNYYLPQTYFDERNRIGRIGCGVYGTLLSIVIMDTIVGAILCMVSKHTISLAQANSARRQVRYSRGALNTGYNQSRPTFISPQPSASVIQDGFVVSTHAHHPELPGYTDIYPEGSNVWENQPNQTLSIPSDPPPAYTDTTSNPPTESPPSYSSS